MHTTYSDGKNTPLEMVTRAREVGYGFCAITDHDIWTPLPDVPDIIVMQGIEHSSFNGRPEHLLEIRGETQVLKIKPHPNRYGDTCAEIRTDYEADKYDAIESTEHGTKHLEYLKCGVPTIWTDDAHNLAMLGRVWITVEVSGTTADDIINAIKNGNYWLGNPPLLTPEQVRTILIVSVIVVVAGGISYMMCCLTKRW